MKLIDAYFNENTGVSYATVIHTINGEDFKAFPNFTQKKSIVLDLLDVAMQRCELSLKPLKQKEHFY